jgi:NTE family protein
LTNPISPTLAPTSTIAAITALGQFGPEELQALITNAEQRVLHRGDVLMREGEPSDELYFVVSGRFMVERKGDGAPLAEIGHGQPIGEIGFFANLPRTATVRALRDSQVLMISRAQFQKLGAASPQIRDAVIVSLAHRLADAIRIEKETPQPRALGIVWAGSSRPSDRFIELLREVFGAGHRTIFLTAAEVTRRFERATFEDSEVSSWLNSLELDADFIFYIAEPTLTEWTKKCIRQADAVLLVATAQASDDINPCERLAFSTHAASARRLVLLHENRSNIVSGTSRWLARRDVNMHHHVALQDRTDVQRLRRFISGKAVGFVAGAGGALGTAHLGVYKAFCEAGADFDIFGGTSVGAAMTAGLAAGIDIGHIDASTHKAFVRKRAFLRFTIPRYALINHKFLDSAFRAEFGDTTIEDLWKPFFAVSTNLSSNKPMVHRRGLLWNAVRASGSIPGVLPPFFTKDGEMLVDGALVDSVPLGPMKALKEGPNVVVALGMDQRRKYMVDYDTIPGPITLLTAVFNPFARRRLPKIPNALQVIMQSVLVHSRPELPLSDTDLLIQPELPADFRFTTWDRHTDVLRCAYRFVATQIEGWMEQRDRRLLAVLDPARTQG